MKAFMIFLFASFASMSFAESSCVDSVVLICKQNQLGSGLESGKEVKNFQPSKTFLAELMSNRALVLTTTAKATDTPSSATRRVMIMSGPNRSILFGVSVKF